MKKKKNNICIDPKLINCMKSSMGSMASFALFMSIITDFITIGWFQAFIAMGFLIGIFSYLFYERKIISDRITVRRFLCLICSACAAITCIFAFGAVALSTRTFLSLLVCYIIVGIGGGMLLGLLADHLEKKYLRQINEKLEKNK